MGLDAVELVMEVEEAFDIALEDAEVEKISTPREVIELVMSKVAHADTTACLTQRAFNRLRAALLRHLPLKRRDIAPQVRMVDLVPKHDRQTVLDRLATDLGTRPPPALVRPQWLVVLLAASCLAVGVGVVFALRELMPSLAWGVVVFAGGAVAVLAGSFTTFATRALRSEFPPLLTTVGDFSCWIVAHKPDLIPSAPGTWTRERVAARVREIVIEQLDCAQTYREDASFVQDLGMS